LTLPADKDILKPYSAVNDIFRISIPEIRLCADMPNGMPSMLLSKEVQPILSR
jgi:pola: DNA polymerase I